MGFYVLSLMKSCDLMMCWVGCEGKGGLWVCDRKCGGN